MAWFALKTVPTVRMLLKVVYFDLYILTIKKENYYERT